MNRIIFSAKIGSIAYGTNLEEKPGDIDILAVVIEDILSCIGISKLSGDNALLTEDSLTEPTFPPAEHWSYKKTLDNDQELDWVGNSLRKYFMMIRKGNPAAITALFAPQECLMVDTAIGRAARRVGETLIGLNVYSSFRGFANNLRHQVIRGSDAPARLNRESLVQEFGFDTKAGYHAVCLAHQGKELLTTGKLTLPMDPEIRNLCLDIRRGKLKVEQVLALIDAGISELDLAFERAKKKGLLLEEPDTAEAEDFLVSTYMRHWDYAEGHNRSTASQFYSLGVPWDK